MFVVFVKAKKKDDPREITDGRLTDVIKDSIRARRLRHRSEIYAINAILKQAEQEQFAQFMVEMEQSRGSESFSYSDCDSDDSTKLPKVIRQKQVTEKVSLSQKIDRSFGGSKVASV